MTPAVHPRADEWRRAPGLVAAKESRRRRGGGGGGRGSHDTCCIAAGNEGGEEEGALEEIERATDLGLKQRVHAGGGAAAAAQVVSGLPGRKSQSPGLLYVQWGRNRLRERDAEWSQWLEVDKEEKDTDIYTRL